MKNKKGFIISLITAAAIAPIFYAIFCIIGNVPIMWEASPISSIVAMGVVCFFKAIDTGREKHD
ncbi:MAG: hypothetical protein MUP17_04935 [candidate division Zixibacteria bacterium]|nr:hypothetical protein [candidate division Zixibacteria bacterium]